MRSTRVLAVATLGLAVLATTGGFTTSGPTWRLTDTGVTARFRGLDPVSAKVAWAAGSAGTILRTVDGGRSWASVAPADAAGLEFRDVEAFDADHAVVLAIGNGEASRIYTTADGGRSWDESFRNDDEAAFYDCVTFLDRRHGLALSDPVGGKFRILATSDGGRTWAVNPTAGMPDALPGEFAFAASGTCLVTADHLGAGRAWFATGGGAQARVFGTTNGGRSWSVTASPLPSGEAAGVFSLAFKDPWHGLAVGGDYLVPASAPDGAATTRDGGRTWTVSRTVPGEYRSGADWLGLLPVALAVGPSGSDITYDGGRTWKRFDTGSFDSVFCAPDLSCWASGTTGRIAKLSFSR